MYSQPQIHSHLICIPTHMTAYGSAKNTHTMSIFIQIVFLVKMSSSDLPKLRTTSSKIANQLYFHSFKKPYRQRFYFIQEVENPLIYRVSHSKDWKVILLWWGYTFWFLLIFWVLRVHEIGPFNFHLSQRFR